MRLGESHHLRELRSTVRKVLKSLHNSTGLCFDNSENMRSLCSRNLTSVENNWLIHIGVHVLYRPSSSTVNDFIICNVTGFFWQLCSSKTLISSNMNGVSLERGYTLGVCVSVCALSIFGTTVLLSWSSCVCVHVCLYVVRLVIFVTGNRTRVRKLISFCIIS